MAGVTVVAPTAQPFPRPVSIAVVEIKENWADEWEFDPALEATRATVVAVGQDMGTAEISHRYGQLKQPWETSIATVKPRRNYAGWWVRIRLAGPQGVQPLFLGRFSSESRALGGSDTGATGVQTLVAYDGSHLLRRLHLYNSIWLVPTTDDPEVFEERVIGWMPPINVVDDRGSIEGNRSNDKSNGAYLFAHNSFLKTRWSRKDALEYFLKRFADDSDNAGPAWRIGGQWEPLDDIYDPITFGETMDLNSIIREIIPTRLGFDYQIKAYTASDSNESDGFEVYVFPLSSREATFGGSTVPKNPRAIAIKQSTTLDVETMQVVRTADQTYGKIQVVGARIVSCFTLVGANVFPPENSLVPKWSDAPAGAGTKLDYQALSITEPEDDAGSRDAYRQQRRFQNVFRLYGAPDNWDWDQQLATVLLNDDGTVVDDGKADFQSVVRRTLSWTPLRAGVNYAEGNESSDKPSTSLDTYENEFRPPTVYVKKILEDDEALHYHTPQSAGNWVDIAEEGISISPLQNDWGVYIAANPNHLLAHNVFSESGIETERQPIFDYTQMCVTIAAETDQRIVMEEATEDWVRSDGILVVPAPEAELWFLEANTVVGVTRPHPQGVGVAGQDPAALDLSGDKDGHGRVLRNDRDRLELVMAGALARYRRERSRAMISIKGTLPWGEMAGAILTQVEDAGDTHDIQAPITSVEWTFGDNPRTAIKTGYAR